MHLLCFGGNFVWYANVHHYLKLDVRAFTPKTEKLSTAHVLYLNFFFNNLLQFFFLSSFNHSLLSVSRLSHLVDHGSQWQIMVHKGASDLVSVAVNQSGSRWLGSVGGPIQLGFWVCQQWLVNNGRGWCLVCSKHRDHFKTE